MKRIVVFGAGYVGLVTGTCLAEHGNSVLVVDTDERRVDALAIEGRIPFHEPGLPALVRRNVDSGRLMFGTKVTAPFDAADFFFIAVGTPPAADGSADVSAVMAVAQTIRDTARKEAVVVIKSTVPIGTCAAIHAIMWSVMLTDERPPLAVVSNPEFLKEGTAIPDFFRADRVVIGTSQEGAAAALADLYRPIQPDVKFIFTDWQSSEMIKYAANTLLATRISFMNELSRLCDATGANIHDVRSGIGSDTRIGPKFLYAGPGYGGSCLPKDVQALAMLGRKHGVEMPVTEGAHESNERQISFVEHLIFEALDADHRSNRSNTVLAGKRIAFWGLAFKPETDDVREAPSVRLARRLIGHGATIAGYDPEAAHTFARAVDGAEIAATPELAIDGADVLVLLTEWRCFRTPDFADVKRRMAMPRIIDARNVWRPEEVRAAGLFYQGVGVP